MKKIENEIGVTIWNQRAQAWEKRKSIMVGIKRKRPLVSVTISAPGGRLVLTTLLMAAVCLSTQLVRSFTTSPKTITTTTSKRSNTVSLFMDSGVASSLLSSDASNLDRFRSVCLVGPESKEAVVEFDSELYESLHSEPDDLWVAVYRSNNNKPSVVVRDDFFRAMNDATTTKSGVGFGKTNNDNDETTDNTAAGNESVSTVSGAASFLSDTMPSLLEIPSTKPVAIARLQKSSFENNFNQESTVYLLDNLRCSLKKEDQDETCDGGSEFVEALSVAVDTLLLKHLQRLLKNRDDDDEKNDGNNNTNDVIFEGTIRTKATLFSGKVFEQRGFAEVETLSRDMATHVSNYDACFSNYADRTIETTMAAGTRDRALQIVALLGRLDPEVQKAARGGDGTGNDDDEYDPWANMQLYRSCFGRL